MINSIYQYIQQMEVYQDQTAVKYYDNTNNSVREISYNELIRDIRSFACRLTDEYPDIKGKHIGIFSRNCYAYLVAFFGIMLAKAVVVPFNYNERYEVIENEIKLSDVSVMLVESRLWNELPKLQKIDGLEVRDIQSVVEPFFTNLHEISDEDIDMNVLRLLIFTSGTTGTNKCVMLSMKNLSATTEYYRDSTDKIKDKFELEHYIGLLMLPMYHVAAQTLFLPDIYYCNPIYIVNDIKYIFRDIQLSKAQTSSLAPIMLELLYNAMKSGHLEKTGELKCVYCGGGSFDHQMLMQFKEHDIYIVPAYGMSETFGVGPYFDLSITDPNILLNSVGKCAEGMEASIRNGEICFKGDTITSGYYKNPEATAELFDEEGWLHSGDLGYMDEQGYIYLTGRRKNIIILASGENVIPEELEGLLRRCSAMKEVLVKEKEGRICAEVFCDLADRPFVQSFVNQINRELAMYKRITLIEFRNEPFERTGTGKIRRG